MSGCYDKPLTSEQVTAVKDEGVDFSDVPDQGHSEDTREGEDQ